MKYGIYQIPIEKMDVELPFPIEKKITKEKMMAIYLHYEEQQKKKEESLKLKTLLCPPICSEEDILKYGLTSEFVASQRYFNENYIEISNKYGDAWVIISKNGVDMSSDNSDQIRKVFYSDFVGKAILSKASRYMN